MLAQVGALLEDRVADQGGVDGQPYLGVESLDHGLDRYGKVLEESVPLRQEMRSDGSLEIGRVQNEASRHLCGLWKKNHWKPGMPRRKTRFERAR